MIAARINAIAHALPETVIDNQALAARFPEWPAEKIGRKLGIERRHVVAAGETALDLAGQACLNLFRQQALPPESIDALIFCTQSPDFILPPNSCLLHKRLGLRENIPVFDYNHGCSGFVYGLFLAKSLIESGQAMKVLLVNAETYSRLCSEKDKNVISIFGDAATATLLTGEEAGRPFLDNFVFHTDGTGAPNLVVPASGQRRNSLSEDYTSAPLKDGSRTLEHLYMNGPAIFEFAMREVPRLSAAILNRAGLSPDDIAAVIFHQANAYMLQSLRMACGFRESVFMINMKEVGNTVSCSIPLVLEDALASGAVLPGQPLLLIGFGVGYASAGCICVI